MKVREERRGDLEQVGVVLVARVCHLRWQLCKLPLSAATPDLATVDSLLTGKILENSAIVNHV